ncbi:MAG: alpha/beta fold hydrolase [Spirochaeta sp.]
MINTQKMGKGSPVVFLHGLFGSGENLASLARRLPEGYQAILADLPSHGGSSDTEDMAYDSIADILADELLEPLNEPVILVGHSMGGKAAMMLALRYSSQVRGAVFLDIAPVSYPDKHSGIFDAMQAVTRAAPASRSEADAVLSSHISDPHVRGFLLKNFVQGQVWRIPVEQIAAQYPQIRGWDMPEGSSGYHGPSLCIYGQKSEYVQENVHRTEFEKWFPRIQMTAVPGAEHWLHATHTAQVSEELNRFLLSVQ